jgi:hypothetical protein
MTNYIYVTFIWLLSYIYITFIWLLSFNHNDTNKHVGDKQLNQRHFRVFTINDNENSVHSPLIVFTYHFSIFTLHYINISDFSVMMHDIVMIHTSSNIT